ncbi:uncharacterized protein F5Z01DRAFT_639939 [Emericellopsis atlantica]|uniref:Uncharacterized protein n=1 Tax=Emericellopsis atlantica TaxID=2614577 RepID=A0A9P7ZFU6_9HYPO|nr:uncharacterized protein F5Z01DRAFT_639939 [Emericellopsis atlantica]KAG9250698.1 hypothetical protein F5Z01DRAFT_639939 [Emericellopsis atlantica]
MRFFPALVAAVGLAGKAQACLSLHAYIHNKPLAPSACILQLWDKPEGEGETEVWTMETCDAPFAIDNEDYMCNEDDIYKACITNNSKKGHIWNRYHSYDKQLDLINTDYNSYCCAWSASGGCILNCSEYESCLNDNWGCGSCNLCDFRSYCDDHYKLFRRDLPQSPAQKRSDNAAKIAELEKSARQEQEAYIAEHGQEEFDAIVQGYRLQPARGMKAVE